MRSYALTAYRYSRRVDPQALQREALDAIASAASVAELDDARIKYLGRKSELKLALREVRDRETGMALNAAREARRAGPSPWTTTRPPARRRRRRRSTRWKSAGRRST